VRRILVIGAIIIGLAIATVHFYGVTANTLILFIIAAFAGGFFLRRRRRANNR